jgi:ribulose-phosphate 3-epimerase
MNNIIISPSMLSADFAHLDRDLKKVAASGADWLHLDIMDGHFVPNITIGPDQVKNLRGCIDLPFDTHLMISRPLQYIPRYAQAGADIITFHEEVQDDAWDCIRLIRQYGKKPGMVISPDTPVEVLAPYLDDLYMVLVMSVYPGFGGQKYIEASTERLAAIHRMIDGRPVRLEIDGGINFDTLPGVIAAGADTIVSGSCLFGGDMAANLTRFKEIIKGALH